MLSPSNKTYIQLKEIEDAILEGVWQKNIESIGRKLIGKIILDNK